MYDRFVDFFVLFCEREIIFIKINDVKVLLAEDIFSLQTYFFIDKKHT